MPFFVLGTLAMKKIWNKLVNTPNQIRKMNVWERIGYFYKHITGHITLMCMTIFALLCISIVLDIMSLLYHNIHLPQFFSYEESSLIAVILVVWTFTATLVVFYLEKMEERRYGIRMIEILLITYRQKALFVMTVTFMAELFVLILASIISLKLTLVVSAVIQFCTMLFVFVMVCVETSKDHVQQAIEEQYQVMQYTRDMKFSDLDNLFKPLLLIKMIRNLDYSNKENIDDLLHIIKNKPQHTEWQHADRDINRKIIEYIIESENDKDGLLTLLVSKFQSEEESLEAKKGILLPLIEVISLTNLRLCEVLLKTADKKYQKNLYIWCVSINMYLEDYNDERWRKHYTARIYENIRNEFTEKDRELLLKNERELADVFNQKSVHYMENASKLLWAERR